MTEKVQYRAPALEKGLDILEALSVATVPQTLTDLSRTLRRSPSELFRMITLLENRGYLVKDSRGYSLSLKLYELAHTHSPVDHLLRAAREPMRDLAAAVRESCHLGVLFRGALLVLTQEESPDKVRLSFEVGGRFSAVHTASGRLLLAHLPTAELDAFCADDPDYLALDDQGKDWFQAELARIRDRGYSLSEDESLIGVRDVSALVGSPQLGTAAALTVTGLTQRRSRRQFHEVLDPLLRAARQVTVNMGLESETAVSPLRSHASPGEDR
jgi:DNA-binding IclR family transcriptional regulator